MSADGVRKKRGRPAGREFPVAVQLRLSTEQHNRIKAWSDALDSKPSANEAMRELIDRGLDAESARGGESSARRPIEIYLDLEAQNYTQSQVLSVLPLIKEKTLQNWRERGITRQPDYSQALGKGVYLRYSALDIIRIALIDEIVEFGLPVSAASVALKYFELEDRVRECIKAHQSNEAIGGATIALPVGKSRVIGQFTLDIGCITLDTVERIVALGLPKNH